MFQKTSIHYHLILSIINRNRTQNLVHINNVRETLNLPDNTENNTRINEGLLKAINHKREKEGEKTIEDINYQIIRKDDIDELVKSEQRIMNPSISIEEQVKPKAVQPTADRGKYLYDPKTEPTPPKAVKPIEYLGDPKDQSQGQGWEKVGTTELDLAKENNLRDNYNDMLGNAAKTAWKPDLPERMQVTNWELSPEENNLRDKELKNLGAAVKQNNNLDVDEISAIIKRDAGILKELETTFNKHGIELSVEDKNDLAMVWGNAKLEKTPTKLEKNDSPLGQDIEQIFNQHHKKMDSSYLNVLNHLYPKTAEKKLDLFSKEIETIFNSAGKELSEENKVTINNILLVSKLDDGKNKVAFREDDHLKHLEALFNKNGKELDKKSMYKINDMIFEAPARIAGAVKAKNIQQLFTTNKTLTGTPAETKPRSRSPSPISKIWK